MRNSRIVMATLAIAASLFAASCSDDSTTNSGGNNTTTGDFQPLKQGNLYVYKSADLDNNKNEIDSTRSTDSVTYGAQMSMQGKNPFQVISLSAFNSGKRSSDTSYIVKESNALLEYGIPVPEAVTSIVPVSFVPLWIKTADFAAAAGTKWQIIDTTFTNVDFTFSGVTGKASGRVTINYERQADASVTFGNPTQTKSAAQMLLTTTFSGTLSAFGQTIPVNFTIKRNESYVPDIGLVRISQDPVTINLTLTTIPVAGYTSILQSYKLN